MSKLFSKFSGKKTSAVIALAIFLPSCANFSLQSNNLNTQIDKLLAQNEYADIHNIYLFTAEENPQFTEIQSRKPEVARHRAKYIRNVINAAAIKKQQQKWQQAIDIFDLALNKLSNKKELQQAKSELVKIRDFQVNELRKELLFRKASELIKYQSIYEKLMILVPEDNFAQDDIEKHIENKKNVAKQLMDCSDHAMSIHDYFLAEKCLKISYELVPTNTKKLTLEEVTQKKNLIQKNQDINLMMSKYKNYYESGDLVKARLNLQKILSIDNKQKRANKLMQELKKEIARRTRHGLRKGKMLYSKGLIKQSLKVWGELKLIAPDNAELKGLINRATKVNKNLKELKKQM